MSTDEFVTYDVKLPDRTLLKSMIALGWFMIVTGVGMLGWSLVKSLIDELEHTSGYGGLNYCDYLDTYTEAQRNYWEKRCSSSAFLLEWIQNHWYIGLMLLVFGTVVAGYCHNRFQEYYRKVRQGRILARHTAGSYHSFSWQLLVEGNTYANERRQQWRTVNAGFWHETKVGDWVNLR